MSFPSSRPRSQHTVCIFSAQCRGILTCAIRKRICCPPWTWWWQNGRKKEEGDYVNGRRLGDWVEYGEDGKKLGEGMYRNGTKEGPWTVYLPGSDAIDHVERWAGGQMMESKPAPAATN